ncbi:MAG: ABC transporter ATP-binding protein [Candidatus Limivivens sp.]|nr:ABC transporter ATP-binding protein [Candidatus Limivivens sp.]
MLKLLKHLKEFAGEILIIVILLFIQANCDLSLPEYTSSIVNVGIQQGGVEDAVAEDLRAETMDRLRMFMDEEEKSLVERYYTLEDGLWHLNKISRSEREELNQAFSKPMMAVYALSSGENAGQMLESMGFPAGADPFETLQMMPEEQFSGVKDAIFEKFEEYPDTLTSQFSVAFVKAEYEAQGVDMNALQTRYLLRTGLKMLGFALIIMLAAVMVTFLSCRVAAGMSRKLREMVFRKVMSFSNAEFDQFSTASLITRSTNDIQQVQMLLTMLFRIVLYAPIVGIGGVYKALKTNINMAWIIVLAVGLIIAVVLVLMVVAMPKFNILQTLIDRLNLVSREILQGIPVIRAFSREIREKERFEEANKNFKKVNLFVNRCMTFMMPLMMFIMNGITVLIVYRGAVGIDNGTMQVGDMMAYIQYTMMIIMSFLMLTMMSIMLPRALVSARRINEILDTKVSVVEPKEPRHAREDKKGYVEFKDVSFAYPGAEDCVLEHISFTAKPGETTAIIGSTGCGKSTLVNLIPRFFDVKEGQVLVDGVDVREMSRHELNEKLGYVPQKGVLFSGTIDSNIRYGCEDAPEETVKRAAGIAQATEFILEKEDQFRSPISQGGTNVSGGQKQRLSIARAIAKNPEIYIFDDSFSALDYKTDVALRKALKETTSDATTIIVAQRISTILHAEQIIVLDDGKIAGIGTHKELLKNCEVYEQIATSQLSKEELENE